MTTTETTPAKRQKWITMTVAVLITLALLFYMVTFQVRFTQHAVVTTFGEPTRSITQAGLYWKWPYPLEDVYPFDARIQVWSGKLEQIFTSDGKNIIISTYVGWQIHDPQNFLKSCGTMEKAEKDLEGLVRSFTNGVIARYPFSNLVSENKDDIRLQQIESEILQLLNEGESGNQGLKTTLGITVRVFGIQKLELPEKTTREVFNRMREERNRIAENYRSIGEGKAQEIKARADAEKQALLIEAAAKAKIIRGEGDAAAAKYFQTFAQNRELAIWLRKLAALEKLLESEKLTLVLDSSTSPYDILVKEKPKMKNNSSSPVQQEDSKSATPVTDSPVQQEDSKSTTPATEEAVPESSAQNLKDEDPDEGVSEKDANESTSEKPATEKTEQLPTNGESEGEEK